MQEKKTSKNLKIRKVCIVGVIPSFAFQRAKHCALELHRKLPQRFPLPEIVGLLELDWSEKLQEWRQLHGREYWCLRRPVAVFFDNRFIGSDIELIKLTTISNILLENIPRKDMSCLKQNFRKDYISCLKNSKRVYCYLDICVDDVYAGTLTFRLYSDLLPRTCENFKTLCLGSRGPLLSYKGSRIHRIVKKGWLQGGDIQYKTGGGGFSIFCDPLEDESFGISHDRRGVLSMANAGRHKNGSQFFITLQPSKWMDTHFVAFGQLIEGVKVLKKLEDLETFYETPIKKVEIKNCGKLDLGDIEDVDVLYKEEKLPPKKRKRIETISAQIIRQIIEALTEALKKKVHPPDILDDGDIPSKMNLQLYFQGFYSLPRSILEKSAAYLRNLRRELFRLMKPSATEVVESIMYDLQMAVLTRMTNLDDMRETLGRELYNKMVAGIDMTLEGCKKGYVKRFIDQVVTTAEDMVNLVTKKLLLLKERSQNMKKFQERMDKWVRSFVLQETFEGDNYFIAERPVVPKQDVKKVYEGRECCAKEKKRKEKELKEKMMAKYAPDDFCCLGSQMHFSDSQIYLSDYFNSCRYGLKQKGQRMERMPLLDLIEISRFKLRWLRTGQSQKRSEEMICAEKKIRKWMEEVVYTPETSWLKDAIFPRDCRVLDHVEEIMYGAMTAGLLEMYYFMDEYIRVCGARKRQRLVTKTIYPEDSDLYGEGTGTSDRSSRGKRSRFSSSFDESDEDSDDGIGRRRGRRGRDGSDDDYDTEFGGGDGAEGDRTKGAEGMRKKGKKEEVGPGFELLPCPCGHPCCDCEFDPNQRLGDRSIGDGTDGKGQDGDEEDGGRGDGKDGEKGRGKGKGSRKGRGGGGKRKGTGVGGGKHRDGEEGEGEEEEEEEEGEGDDDGKRKRGRGSSEEVRNPCKSDETLVDLNTVLAQKLSKTPEEVDITSFRWLKPYIMEKGCDLKSKFAAQVHEWIDGERFNTQGFISKHSLVTRASLLSLSLSLADLLKEENNLKSEIKDFVYDLWSLYFQEMFKEAALEYPPKEEKEDEDEGEEGGEEESEDEEGKGKKGKGKGKGKDKDKGKDEDTGKGKGRGKGKGKGRGKGRRKRKRGKDGDEEPCTDDEISECESESGDEDESEAKSEGKGKKKRDKDFEEKCRKLKELFKDSDFDKYCKKFREQREEVDPDSERTNDSKNQPRSPKSTPQDQTATISQVSSERSGSTHPSVHYQSVSGRPSRATDRKSVRPSTVGRRPSTPTSERTQSASARSPVYPSSPQPNERASSRVQPGSERPSTQVQPGSERPSTQVQPGSARPSVQVQPGSERPSVQIQPGSERPSKAQPGSERPSVQIQPGSERPSKAQPGSERPSQAQPGSERPSQAQPGSERPSEAEPGSERPSLQVQPDNEKASTQALRGSVWPSVQVERGSVRPSTLQGMESGVYDDEWSKAQYGSPRGDENESDFEDQTEKKRKSRKQSEKERLKKRKSPIVVQELVEEPSEEEVRVMPPYVPPFWVKFLTETTKQALGAFAKVSRLPQRLYLKTDSQMAFEDRMKDWFEFNAFNPQPTKGREVIDFIALHHKPLANLEDTARSFMKKKKFAGLINRCTRFSSADIVSGEIVSDAIRLMQMSSGLMIEEETVELFVSDMMSSAAVSRGRSDYSEFGGEDYGGVIPTDEKEPDFSEIETEDN